MQFPVGNAGHAITASPTALLFIDNNNKFYDKQQFPDRIHIARDKPPYLSSYQQEW